MLKSFNFNDQKLFTAVIYLSPSLGKKGFISIEESVQVAWHQIKTLVDLGIDAILLENENDQPYDLLAPKETIASMSAIAIEINKLLNAYAPDIHLGVEFLINDPKASLAIAKISNSKFIRTDYFVDRMSREEYGGEIEINPKELLQYRDQIHANHIQIYADIQVKYAKMLESKSLSESASECFEHKASACIVSSHATGTAPCLDDLLEAKIGAQNNSVLIGSGFCLEHLESLYSHCDGAIIGTALMQDGVINPKKAQVFLKELNKLRKLNS